MEFPIASAALHDCTEKLTTLTESYGIKLPGRVERRVHDVGKGAKLIAHGYNLVVCRAEEGGTSSTHQIKSNRE